MLPGDLGLIPIAVALKSATSRAGGKPNVIARAPEPCSPRYFSGEITNWPRLLCYRLLNLYHFVLVCEGAYFGRFTADEFSHGRGRP